ncbi:hypothetical protein [Umezawaea sp. Da 62-37]|uniref:hypothetical protein n=1 Tax=Umezawaea sp. Da 62-37 TaxID=3075927 RepID=UPI0028F6F8CC|nr:hypothetical protein [Umezawaea sp. Da 62-37]WNV91357.1 hypothetical protein RM788_24760 [Umezawaea sp. Da 62-37]
MLKPLLVAVLLTGLCTPVAVGATAPPSTCLEPPVSDKNELCVDLLPYSGKEFAGYGRFVPTAKDAPDQLDVVVQQSRTMWPEPLTIAKKTVTGNGEISAVTDAGAISADATAVRACATGFVLTGSRAYDVCTPWQPV